MPTPNELKAEFWESLKSDMTVMLGVVGAEGGHRRPMTAQVDGEGGPIWFFADRETDLVQLLGQSRPAAFTFSAKGHGLFASVDGTLQVDMDRAVIDRLWNSFIAAWFKEGKNDPRLVLLRFDPGQAEIWENASNLLAGIKALLGSDPREDYRDKSAEVRLA